MMDHQDIAITLGLDRVLAHQVIFAHRHKDPTPAFHKIMIADWHGDHPAVCTMAFRGGAKSTVAEEAILIKAGYREFKNGIVIGETYERACERVEAIRHEVETNERLAEVFGDLRGPVWSTGELVLANGVRILAMGRGQAIRGIKYHDMRPDILFADDLEDEDSVKTAAMRKKTKVWFTKVLVPACDIRVKIRVAATPLDPDALAMDLKRDPSFLTRSFPIEYRDEHDENIWHPTWPGRFGRTEIDTIKERFRTRGLMREYRMEYMCEASSDMDQVFRERHMRHEPRVRTWEAVYGMFDPARTIGPLSATTGFAAWSWVGPRLYIWDSWGRKLLPNEIVEAMFEFNETYSPVWVGVEEDGLNEWLLQPIRQEMVRRGVSLPLKAVKAPRGKLDFIRGLQPFFQAHEVWFTRDFPELKRQLASFPTGEIDAPNALAYAPRMRSGAPVYDDFQQRHVDEQVRVGMGLPMWLCFNATGAMTTAILAQVVDGCLRVFADFVREGDAGANVLKIIQEAQMEAGRAVRIVCGPQHFDKYNNVGLVQAIKAIPAEVRQGVEPGRGRAQIRELLKQIRHGGPGVTISSSAKWTLNGFSDGYARAMMKGGQLADYAEDNAYRVLIEGLESFVGLMSVVGEDDGEGKLNYAYTPDGRRYVSTLIRRGSHG